jgi:hypothetical protein
MFNGRQNPYEIASCSRNLSKYLPFSMVTLGLFSSNRRSTTMQNTDRYGNTSFAKNSRSCQVSFTWHTHS